EVCNRLGLQHGGDTVLLVYDVPSHVTVRYPTLADAYAGPAWNPLFQASQPTDPWGYTSGGNPEVVHDVITGNHLAKPTSAIAPIRFVS
ncbi:MAG: hypothetical protein AAGG50_20445, partial [Bacteroidota bacterium]